MPIKSHDVLAATCQSRSLLDAVDCLRLEATRALHPNTRSERGQFLTPMPIAEQMAGMLSPAQADVALLDAGAGAGSLLAAAIAYFWEQDTPPTRIHVAAYEIDSILIPYLQKTLTLCRDLCVQKGTVFTYDLIARDFLECAAENLASGLFTASDPMRYTHAILNPPYRKIVATSHHRKLLRQMGLETSNLYSGFVYAAVRQLAPGGHLVAITPRSFCNGPYFTPFRRFLLENLVLKQIHLFDSRQDAFRDDAVLQENLIFSGRRSSGTPSTIQITTGRESDANFARHVPYECVVQPHDPLAFIRIAPERSEAEIAERMASMPCRLEEIGVSVSTGRVVDFRIKNHLRDCPEGDTVPLIYPLHLKEGRVSWPKPDARKANALMLDEQSRSLLIPNGPYVLVKRLSSKEERKRVVAAVHVSEDAAGESIGFENHLNYYHQNGHPLDRSVAWGLAAYLNSSLVDGFFRQFNGHTQVNAADLRSLRYPTIEQLTAIGVAVIKAPDTLIEPDAIVDAVIVKNEPS